MVGDDYDYIVETKIKVASAPKGEIKVTFVLATVATNFGAPDNIISKSGITISLES